MNKKIFGLLTFALGAAAGFFAGGFLSADKHRKILEAEVTAAKAFYKQKYDQNSAKVKKHVVSEPSVKNDEKKDEQEAPTPEKPGLKPDLASYIAQVEQYRHPEKDRPHIVSNKNGPVVIPPDEVGDEPDYEVISMTYYADGILVDEDDIVYTKEEIERSVGLSSLSTFGRYEDDSVFVRNDQRKLYFEILLNEQSYADVLKEKPYIQED